MAKAMQKHFHENFYGVETANIYPSESFPVYGSLVLLDNFLYLWASGKGHRLFSNPFLPSPKTKKSVYQCQKKMHKSQRDNGMLMLIVNTLLKLIIG